MVLPTSEYKYTCEWYGRYEVRRDAGQLTQIDDLPADVVLQDNWLDVTSTNLRYFPVDYQDFWIAADVNSTWNFANSPYGATTTQNPIYKNPRYSHQPQPATYHYDWPNGRNASYGWLINTYVGTSWGWTGYGFLCCATDVPQFLSGVTASDYFFLQKGSASNFSSFFNGKMDENIYRDNLRIWAALSSVPISSEYALSAPSFTYDLSCHLSAAPHRVASSLRPYDYYSYSDESSISVYFNDPYKFPNNFGGWFGTAGPITRHQFSRRGASSDWNETYTYQSDYGNTIQRIHWMVDTSLSAKYCDIKWAYPPLQGESQKTFRLYVNSPTFCYYGDLSADLYMAWNVEFNDTTAQYWKKIPLTFERTDIEWTRYDFPTHYLMRSKEVFSFEELFCIWSPFDENDAISKIADLRNKASLSAWNFPPAPIPPSQQGGLVNFAQSWRDDNTFLLWKFKHPLEMPNNYHFTNQDGTT